MKLSYFTIGIIVCSAVLVATLALYPGLPDPMPTHWNREGMVDDSGSKNTAFLLPAIIAFLLLLWRILPVISPKHFRVDSFRKTYDFVMLLIVVLLSYLHAVILWSVMTGAMRFHRFLMAGIFLFILLLGNVLGKVQRNFWMGIRTPWTLADERVWNDTHRFAAHVFVVAGMAGFVLSLAGVSELILVLLLALSTLSVVAFSLITYKRLEKRGEIH